MLARTERRREKNDMTQESRRGKKTERGIFKLKKGHRQHLVRGMLRNVEKARGPRAIEWRALEMDFIFEVCITFSHTLARINNHTRRRENKKSINF